MQAKLNTNHLRRAGIGTFFRPSQADELGITYDQLRCLESEGTVERVAHGLYRLTEAEPTEHHSLAAVCAQVPRSIVCLLSALEVHEIGSQISQAIWLAIPHKARPPRITETEVRLLRFSGAAWTFGVHDTEFEGVPAQHHVASPHDRRLLPVRAPDWPRSRARSHVRRPSPPESDGRRSGPHSQGAALAPAQRSPGDQGTMTRDFAASVKARLLNRAKKTGERYELSLVRYACERFLYRLGASELRHRYVSERGNSPLFVDAGPLPAHTRHRSAGVWKP